MTPVLNEVIDNLGALRVITAAIAKQIAPHKIANSEITSSPKPVDVEGPSRTNIAVKPIPTPMLFRSVKLSVLSKK